MPLAMASCTVPQGDRTGNDAGERLAGEAISRVGTHYRKGVPCQCANFVAHAAEEAGLKPPPGYASARKWMGWGQPVSWKDLRVGDVIVTWRGSPRGSKGHILIYTGDNQAVHRPTRGKTVRITSVETYRGKLLGVRRPQKTGKTS